MPLLADKDNCTGCLACVDICPKESLSPKYNEEGHLFYDLDEDSCISCGLCESICPVLSGIGVGRNELSESQVFAAWAEDKEVRRAGTSGAVFGAIATSLLQKKGLVVGASFERFRTKARIVDSPSGLPALQGSKYMQSDYSGIYNSVTSVLRDGKTVLFSGLACQVAALYSILKKRKVDTSNLITVDLICGGVPSIFLVDSFRHYYGDEYDALAGFRNKTQYEFSVHRQDGSVEVLPITQRPLPLCGFYTELTNRYSCYNCKFAKAHRCSDITIGDFWGDKDHPSERNSGVSVAVAHSSKGESILYSSELHVERIKWRDFLPYNPRMVNGYSPRSKTWQRKQLARLFRSCSYERLQEIYANKVTLKKPWLFVGKAIRWVKGTIWHNHVTRSINSLLEDYENSSDNLSLFK